MKTLLGAALIMAIAAPAASAQTLPNSTPQASYLSVMSKAGTPTPRPEVPVRNVSLPAGAAAGYGYYYGYGYRGYGGSASPSYSDQQAPSTSSTLPGYDTRPRASRTKKGRNPRR